MWTRPLASTAAMHEHGYESTLEEGGSEEEGGRDETQPYLEGEGESQRE